MSQRIKESDIAGTPFRIGDSYIWAEIYYLDSPTDYREFLPQNSAIAPAARGELVMLDSCRSSVSRSFGVLLVVLAVVFLMLGYFLHSILEML